MDTLDFKPLTPAVWKDFETLFGEHGACGGCWCMTWRLKSADYEKSKGEGNKLLMKQLTAQNAQPGLLAFQYDEPIGWIAIARRVEYVRLENSRVLRRVDEQPVWSITCFFIKKSHRGKGFSVQFIQAAVDFAKSKGATIIEAYPHIPKNERMPDVFAWTGLASAFEKAGFTEAALRSETRPVMRFEIR